MPCTLLSFLCVVSERRECDSLFCSGMDLLRVEEEKGMKRILGLWIPIAWYEAHAHALCETAVGMQPNSLVQLGENFPFSQFQHLVFNIGL